MEIDRSEAHVHAVRKLVQSLAGDEGTSGLELFRLLHMVTTALDVAADQHLRDSSLSAPRWVLLLRLLAEERCGCGEGISPTYLSRHQQVSKNTISVLLRGLEEQGLVERTLVPDDRRAFRIRLTDAGRTLVESTTPEHIAFLNGLTGGLTAEESAQLAALLDKLHRSLSVEPTGSGRESAGGRRQETGVRSLTADP